MDGSLSCQLYFNTYTSRRAAYIPRGALLLGTKNRRSPRHEGLLLEELDGEAAQEGRDRVALAKESVNLQTYGVAERGARAGGVTILRLRAQEYKHESCYSSVLYSWCPLYLRFVLVTADCPIT